MEIGKSGTPSRRSGAHSVTTYRKINRGTKLGLPSAVLGRKNLSNIDTAGSEREGNGGDKTERKRGKGNEGAEGTVMTMEF